MLQVLCPTLTAADHARLKPLAIAAMRGEAPGALTVMVDVLAPDDALALRQEVLQRLRSGTARCDEDALSAAAGASVLRDLGLTAEEQMAWGEALVVQVERREGRQRPTLEQELASRSWRSEAHKAGFKAFMLDLEARGQAVLKACGKT